MTIAVAWERRLKDYSEIVFCSDSRLSGSGNIDVCQKIFALPREDAAIAFCGHTVIAYPLINQFISSIKHFKKNIDRALDGSSLPNRFCNLVNQFLKSYMQPAELERELRETSFLIGYFSWKLGRPFIYTIRYDKGATSYVAAKARFPRKISQHLHQSSQFAMIGDFRHEFLQKTKSLFENAKTKKLDLEPLQALCEMLKDKAFIDRKGPNRGLIGGAPQLLKIYPFMRTVEFGVHWPSKRSRKLFINGREAFKYEKLHVPLLNPDDFTFTYPLGAIEDAGVSDNAI